MATLAPDSERPCSDELLDLEWYLTTTCAGCCILYVIESWREWWAQLVLLRVMADRLLCSLYLTCNLITRLITYWAPWLYLHHPNTGKRVSEGARVLLVGGCYWGTSLWVTHTDTGFSRRLAELSSMQHQYDVLDSLWVCSRFISIDLDYSNTTRL